MVVRSLSISVSLARRSKGLGGLFVFPFLELLVCRIIVVPLVNASTVLLAVGSASRGVAPLVVGSVVTPFILGYLVATIWMVVRTQSRSGGTGIESGQGSSALVPVRLKT
jgi:hypothetical protein